MLTIGRRKSRGELVKVELGEGLDHFMQAATHAAEGVGASVGPRIYAARTAVSPTAERVRDTASHGLELTMAAIAPVAAAAVEGARQAGETARKATSKNMRTRDPKVLKPKRKPTSSRGRRRWSMIIGVLAAGTAIGTIVVRRRRATQWEEYDPGQALDSMRAAGSAAHEAASGQPSFPPPG